MKNKNKEKTKEATPPTCIYRRLRGFTIKKPQDIVKLLNRLINVALHACSNDELVRLKSIAYASTVILKAFECGELEERLETLEDKLSDEHQSEA